MKQCIMKYDRIFQSEYNTQPMHMVVQHHLPTHTIESDGMVNLHLQSYPRILWISTTNTGFTQERHGSGKWCGEHYHRGVYKSGIAAYMLLFVSLKRLSTSANPAAQCCYEPTLHALFFQPVQAQRPIRVTCNFISSDRFPHTVLRSRANLVEQQIRNCVVIGCRFPEAENNTCRIGALPLDHRKLSPTWRPFWQVLSGNRVVAAHVSPTKLILWLGFRASYSNPLHARKWSYPVQTLFLQGQEYAYLFQILDQFVLTIFVAEIILKWYHGFKLFWKVGWNILDFIIVAALLFGKTESSHGSSLHMSVTTPRINFLVVLIWFVLFYMNSELLRIISICGDERLLRVWKKLSIWACIWWN